MTKTMNVPVGTRMPKYYGLGKGGKGKGGGKRFGHQVKRQKGESCVRICDIEKLIRRGGARRTSLCFKTACRTFSERLIRTLSRQALIYMRSAGRKTMKVDDIKEAARFISCTLYS